MHYFTKTGSGQTQEKLKKSAVFVQLEVDAWYVYATWKPRAFLVGQVFMGQVFMALVPSLSWQIIGSPISVATVPDTKLERTIACRL